MTTNPPTLVALGHYWEAQGGVNLGVVGDASHAEKGTSYHLGKSQLTATAYSRQTARDKAGLSEAASAIDLGRLNGSLDDLWAFSRWFAQQCMDHRVEYRDVREVIFWSTARSRVLGWSSLEPARWINDYGDASHRTHTHVSFYRDSEYRDKVSLFAPYFPEVETVISYPVPATPSIGTVAVGTWLYDNSALQPSAGNVQVTPARDLPYLGQPTSTYRIVEYVNDAGVHSGKAYFVKAGELANVRAVPPPPDTTPYTQVQLDQAYNSGLVTAQAAVSSIPRR